MAELRILCLEDAALDRELVESALRAADVQARIHFIDSRLGFESALKSDRFDVILADYTLPGYSGDAALVFARQQAPDIPFIFLSGTISTERALETLRSGATDYVLKEHLERLAPAVMRAVTQAQVISARKEAELNLRRIEERYLAVFDRSFDAVFLHDFEGRFFDANRAALDLLGYSAEDVPYLDLNSVLGDSESLARARESLQRHLQTGLQELPQEYRLRRKDGRAIWVEVLSSLVMEEGRPVAIQGIARDITRQKEAELERQRLVKDLAERIKELRALHEIASFLKHELTPLEELFEKVAEAVAKAMQRPESAVVRCWFERVCFATAIFKETEWRIAAEFKTASGTSGAVEVFYLSPPEVETGSPFLPEEKEMLASVADMLRAYFERKSAVAALQTSNERFGLQHAALTELTRSRVFQTSDLQAALREISEKVSRTCGVERVSVWRCNPACDQIACLDLFESSSDRHSSGTVLTERQCPGYFKAVRQSEIIDAHDAFSDERTHELGEGYLKPLGITAMLDVPIHLESEVVGVLCLEHVGSPRVWRADEQSFALAVANLVSLAVAQWLRHQDELKLEEQASLLNHARDAIFVMDLNQVVTYWNKGAEATYGWQAEEAVGRSLSVLIRPDPALFHKAVESAGRLGEWSGEMDQLRKDGRKVLVESRWASMRDDRGQPRSTLCIQTDITEKKRLEAQFLRAQRLESIGTLAGGIAHDLNNVLAPIMMGVEVLGEEVHSPGGKELLATMQASAERGAGLVKQVLGFARGVESRKMLLDPSHILRELLNTLKNTFPKFIELRLIEPRVHRMVMGDATQLHQVFMNLAVNARDAMPEGGRLTISLENVDLDEVYCGMNPSAEPGPYIQVSVADTGTGIPPEAREMIFDPFFTTKQVGKGTGLGLSTSLAIVKSHGGFVDFTTEMGQGTTFKVFLPAHAHSQAGNAARNGEPQLPRGNDELILVVDDEEGLRRVARKTLERFGYRVALAANGVEAVSIYAQRRRDVALVLTDLAMPIMDGPALIGALKAIDPGVKIIASSGHASYRGLVSTVTEGIRGFVPKPYTAETLLRKVAETLSAAE